MADFDAIREWTLGKVVAVHPEALNPNDAIMVWLLSGSVLIEGEPTFPQMRLADFVVSRNREHAGLALVTPENRELFLHAAPSDVLEWYRAERRRVESQPPAARADFNLYMDGDTLYYIKNPRAESDARGGFFLSVHPVSAEDLPESRRALGHDSLNFWFASRGTPVFDGACMAKAPLPDYPIRLIETGRRAPGEGMLWSGEAVLDD